MLIDAAGAVLPLAAAVALSPFPVIGVILVLGTERSRANGLLFALGWVAGLTAVSVVVVAITGAAADPESATASGVGVAQVVAGAAFLVLALRKWRARPRAGAERETPPWMAKVSSFSAGRCLVLGLALSAANPKNLALTAAAAASIATAALDPGQDVVAIAVFVVIGSVTVVGPVLFHLVAPARAAGPLASVKSFMTDYEAVIMIVIFVLLGAKLIGDGLAGVSH